MTSIRNQVCCCCVIVVIILIYFFYFHSSIKKSTLNDPEMHAAILVKSDSCGFCKQQLDLLMREGGPQAQQRIKILDTQNDAGEIKRIMGEVSSVPLWYDPISKFKSPGLKTIAELKNMGIILDV